MAFLMDDKALRAALKAAQARVDEATKVATATGAALIVRETAKTLKSTTHKKDEPTPSRPGEPPSLVTGQLRRSVRTETPVKVGPGTYEARIGPTAVYGRIQELGGRAGRNGATDLPSRPYLRPTVNALVRSGKLQAVFRAAWTAAWTKGG